MNSSRPYLINALVDWIVDNHCTPYIVVSAEVDGVEVPHEHVSEGKIVLNISANSIRNFDITDEVMTFDSRFGGVPLRVVVPTGAVVAVYAKESGEGMAFEVESNLAQNEPSLKGRPTLKVIR